MFHDRTSPETERARPIARRSGTGHPAGAYGDRLGSRLGIERAPVFVNRSLKAGEMAVTEIRSEAPRAEISDPIPVEDAFLVLLVLRDYRDHVAWEGGRQNPVRTIRAGETLLSDLKRSPRVLAQRPYHLMHFYLPRPALDAIADDAGARRIDDLDYSPGVPVDDPVIRGLAGPMRWAFESPERVSRLFIDHVMMALAVHVAQSYGGMKAGSGPSRGGLAAWQERRAKDLLAANVSGDVGLGELAAACGLSVSHFSRAFRASAGLAPHQWLLRHRVEAAKALMRDPRLPLAEVALACGFADQSHFTRVFSRLVGASPGSWRRGLAPAAPDDGFARVG